MSSLFPPLTPSGNDTPLFYSVCWQQAMAHVAAEMHAKGAHPAQTVVLLPYAQLIPQARQAWAQRTDGTAFVPRFETTMNWASSLGASLGVFSPSGTDLRMDVAVDMLTASSLLARAGLAAQQNALAGRLVEAAWSLARVAAAVLPAERMAWSESLAEPLGVGLDSPVLALEAAVGRIALVWAASSAYATDRLFHAELELLVVLQGFQTEPLSAALGQHFADRSSAMALCPLLPHPDIGAHVSPALYPARDAEDEASQAAACILAQLARGCSPVALVAQDRQLTRRVGAMLAERGVLMRDETGWKLSTTRAAAGLMALLRAAVWDASSDAVLDWLKNAPAFSAVDVTATEIGLRALGVRAWRDLPTAPLKSMVAAQALAPKVNALRERLTRARLLPEWLDDLRSVLQQTGQWEQLLRDDAGLSVLEALRLHDGAGLEFEDAPQMNLKEFTAWANQALEAATFSPEHPAQEQVVILPLAQLLGRAVQAVVLPGCDEIRLPVSPEPPGQWSPNQRELLGLPSRLALAQAARQAWNYALQLPQVALLWRTSENGEHLMPSGFVQELLLDVSQPANDSQEHGLGDQGAPDPRVLRSVLAQPTPRPLPVAAELPVAKLSASAYEDLRRCPYRFFALRQLKLQESDELESELGKRDFGNWLHSLLHHFHEALKVAPTQDTRAQVAMLNVAAEQAAQELGLSDSEFLPFAAAWGPVREGYLTWLATHEATGAQYEAGEIWLDMPLGAITLVGKIDRIDRVQQGDQSHALLMDYKTESRTTTAERLKNSTEDTQLAFYAALMPDGPLAAAYVNLGEKEPTRTYEQPGIVRLRGALRHSIQHDMTRIAAGAVLPALGEGKACDYCAARGLCRKDFWTE